jgi:hypothetical protein
MTTTWMVLVIVLWAAVLLLITLVLGLSRRTQDLAAALHQSSAPTRAAQTEVLGPRVGTFVELESEAQSLTVRGSPRSKRIVLFLNASCAPCHMFGDELIAAREDGFVFDGHDFVLVTDELGADFYRVLSPNEIVVQRTNEISRRLGINATPYGLAIDSTGRATWSGIASNFDDLLLMLASFDPTRDDGAPADFQ